MDTHRDTSSVCTQRTGPGRAQLGGGCLQAQERGLRRNHPADTLILDLQLPENEKKNKFLVFKPLNLWHFVMADNNG